MSNTKISDDPRMPLFLFSGERDWVARWAGAKRMETFINRSSLSPRLPQQLSAE
jgi:hypothetical protein